jgi:hypothetical protein
MPFPNLATLSDDSFEFNPILRWSNNVFSAPPVGLSFGTAHDPESKNPDYILAFVTASSKHVSGT